MRHEQIKLYIECDRCGVKEWGAEKDNFESLQTTLVGRGWLFVGNREHCTGCRSEFECTTLTDGDKELIQNFFYSSFPPTATDQDVLNGWYRVVSQIFTRHKTWKEIIEEAKQQVSCRHDLNSSAVDAKIDRINKMANEKCRHGVVFAEDCGDCWGDV